MSLIQVNHLSYQYRTKAETVLAVRDVTAEFEAGRLYAIVGKSGSGKTTLLNLLAGLDEPSEGEILFLKTPLSKLDRSQYRRSKVSVIYQSYNLMAQLTVTENVMLPLLLNKTSKKEAKSLAQVALKRVELPKSTFNRLPALLSGGEQQRVAIARALATGGEVILADEPTGNLDKENGDNVISILKKLAHENNLCVIVVTHDTSVAERADTVFTMSDGRLTPSSTGNLKKC
ncbi:MAG: ABC transporter ATP-binding protein [Clostridia bacterium]|nr:ABC transporter ATP-binding protein [Clostridia bacterium]